jgi:hypothetical protein
MDMNTRHKRLHPLVVLGLFAPRFASAAVPSFPGAQGGGAVSVARQATVWTFLFLTLFAFAPMLANAAVCAPTPTSGTVINVRNTGATGNGNTNDTAAIQAAVNQVPAGAPCLYLTAHTWWMLSPTCA